MLPLLVQNTALKHSKALDSVDVEALVLNLDASLKVHARAHFSTWTQGLLQSLLRHDVLICALRTGGQLAFHVDSFSTLVADAQIFSEPLAHDVSLATRLVEAWKDHCRLPVLLDLQGSVIGHGVLARELERVGATQLAVHGCHDCDGEVTAFFAFACRDGRMGARQLHLMRLAVPFLHTAWMRSRMQAKAHGAMPASRSDFILTVREQEVLKWIYLGKSNGEIGLILGISPLTVKDHVKNLLRKLNVANRAQAVGKAFDARILSPDGTPCACAIVSPVSPPRTPAGWAPGVAAGNGPEDLGLGRESL
jgi:transcriptional regulator EpsA